MSSGSISSFGRSQRKMKRRDDLKCIHCKRVIEEGSNSNNVYCPGCHQITPVNTPTQKYSFSEATNKHSFRLSDGFKKMTNRITGGSTSYKYESLNISPSVKAAPIRPRQPRKRALLCGVSYKKQRYRLKGTINDVKGMRELLIETYNFPKDSIRVLTEEEKDFHFIPTKKNMQDSLQWLVDDCQSGDSLVFYYSGHGLRQLDFNNDERDGFDETLCPVDFKKEGMILDNDINSTIVRPLERGVKLHAIIDACHSGTVLDLIHVYDWNQRKWVDNSPPSGANKSTRGGVAICFSACEDHQLAADTSTLSGSQMTGAMTYCLIKAIKEKSERTYGELLEYMTQTIENADEGKCFQNHFLRRLFVNRIYQQPQLSSSEKFEVETEKFHL